MIKNRRKIVSGLYLVIDPLMNEYILFDKLNMIIKEKIVALQIWDNFQNGQDIQNLIQKICTLCHTENIPVLINNKWEYLNSTSLDGVHFDCIPSNFEIIRKNVKKPFISGVTCNNDISQVHWATKNQLDYISFCSMFPSATATSCELVNFDTVHKAKMIYSKPVFLAGGVKPENIQKLDELDYDGIAVISGIMNNDEPNKAIREYYKKFKIKI